MQPVNETACAVHLGNVQWYDPLNLLALTMLVILMVVVIIGNLLVIGAVLCTSKLRSVTNFFIVSLAVADLLVGVAVLPFSSIREVYKVWIFGDTWCSLWLAVDVCMCTASILNITAISLDRYLAVTKPIKYPTLMSPRWAKVIVVAIWLASFSVCFPPLVGWTDNMDRYSTHGEDEQLCLLKCDLTNQTGYVVYSALGSFFVPLFAMLFFYWRIYRAAVGTTRAINQGYRTTKGIRALGDRFEEQRLTLRIHRGRGSSTKHHHGSPHSNGSNSTATTGSASPSPSARGRHERVKISVSYPSSENLSSHPSPQLLAVTPTSPVGHPSYVVHYSVNGKENSCNRDNHLKVKRLGSHRRPSRRSSSCDSGIERLPSPSPSNCEDKRKSRRGRKNIKSRLRMETKAAKTLGIIVGGFICCWLPFFTTYLIRAFCSSCIHDTLFSVLFWLGYCNSAINPLIYALFSKDFRFAFKRIICTCFCKDRECSTSRRGSDGSQLQGKHRSPSFNIHTHANSLGDDSDPLADHSESR